MSSFYQKNPGLPEDISRWQTALAWSFTDALEGLRSNSALLELARLAPSAARILSSIEALLETAPSTLRSELQEAHDAAWAALEFGLESDERRAA